MGTLKLEVEKGLYLGIDFGTTNSVVSIFQYDTNEVHTLKIDGYTVFPTVVQFEMDDEKVLKRVFGIEAKEAEIVYPESTVSSIKRFLESDEPISIQLEDRQYTFEVEAIVAEILAHLKEQADLYIREELGISGTFSGCVITVPANSTDKQKRKMKKAATIAGFVEDNIYLRLEPAAAAIFYATKVNEDKKVLVYDFGGGTFDACVLQISQGDDEPELKIVSTFGDNYLGGNDIDQLMLDLVYDNFVSQTKGAIDLFDFSKNDGLTPKEKKLAIVRLKQVANHAKEKLSIVNSTKITLAPFIQQPIPINIQIDVTRDQFYSYKRHYALDDKENHYVRLQGKSLHDLIEQTIFCVTKCIASGNLAVHDIDEVFLVGGSSSIPKVREAITQLFGKEPFQAMISPALSISQGAAHYCNQIMLPNMKGPKIHEISIHSLGIEISGRRYLEIIKPGLTIPEEGLTIEARCTLETNFDDLTSLAISVYEDLEPDEAVTKFVYDQGLKRLSGTTLRGIPERKKGEEKIKITFSLSRDNILTVYAISLDDEGISTTLKVDELYEK
jgi:molecular chaperone DnaK